MNAVNIGRNNFEFTGLSLSTTRLVDFCFRSLMHFRLNNQFSSHLDPNNCRLMEIISLLSQQRGSFGEKQAHSVVSCVQSGPTIANWCFVKEAK